MIKSNIVGIGRPKLLCRWWLKTRPCKQIILLNGLKTAPIEFYVPIWAWPLELLYRMIFGYVKLSE